MGDQCSLVNDLRGGDHHKRRVMLAGVNHDERCLEAADEIERLRAENVAMQSALDAAEIAGGITENGNLWRFWAKQARDIAAAKEGEA